MTKAVVAVAITAFAVAGTSACATKGYVQTQVGQVNTKVDTLSQSLEETQQRTRANEERITAVDGKAGAAQTAADQAASGAKGATTSAQQANAAAAEAAKKAETVEGRVNRVMYEVVLSESQGNFAFGTAALPDAAKARLDELVAQVRAEQKGVYVEIEGHTDNVGSAEGNKKLGLDRAEAVKAYLYMQHQVPLHRMNVVSYGEEKPAAPNTTREGRAGNRRVVIRIVG